MCVCVCVCACACVCVCVMPCGHVHLQDGRKSKGGDGGGGLKKVIENLPELWDDKQYADEYDLSGFMKSLTAIEK